MPTPVPKLWRNWAGNQVCAPSAIERPGSEAEVVDVVQRAVADGRRVKVVGSGHSFTPIACTDGHLVDIGRLDRVLHHDVDAGTVTVEAGVTLAALCDELDARGL